MPAPGPDPLLERFARLPAAQPLLSRLAGDDPVYLVGGAVRDLLLGGSPVDLDLVVDGELDPVARRLGASVRSHDRFATCTIVRDGFTYDLARARQETYAHPGALPTVSPATITTDLRRRDFTVNALALGLGGPGRGALLEVPGGLEDLRRRRLRVLHDRSFADDPTRLLRLARYAGRLTFSVEEATLARARQAAAGGALDTVSGERLGAELRLLARQARPIAGFRALHELGVDEALAPGFGIRTAAARQLAARALDLLPAEGDPGALVVAVAGLELPASRLRELLERLAFPAAPREVILATAGRARELARGLRAAERPSQIAAAARSAPVELVALAGALGPEPAARRWLHDLRHVRLEIDGHDLLDAGVVPGPEVGAGLERALAAKLDGRARGREGELAAALGPR